MSSEFIFTPLHLENLNKVQIKSKQVFLIFFFSVPFNNQRVLPSPQFGHLPVPTHYLTLPSRIICSFSFLSNCFSCFVSRHHNVKSAICPPLHTWSHSHHVFMLVLLWQTSMPFLSPRQHSQFCSLDSFFFLRHSGAPLIICRVKIIEVDIVKWQWTLVTYSLTHITQDVNWEIDRALSGCFQRHLCPGNQYVPLPISSDASNSLLKPPVCPEKVTYRKKKRL